MKTLQERNTVQDVARYWGCCVRTVRHRIRSGALRCILVGNSIRVTREQVLEYEGRSGCADVITDAFISSLARPPAETDRKTPTVGQLLTLYKEGHQSEVRAPEALGYAVISLQRHLGDQLPETLLPSDMKSYAQKRKEEGVGNGTILREVGVLRAAFSWAVAHRTLAARPVIKNPVRAPRPRQIWITRDQASALVRESHFPHLRLFVKLGLMTLARTSAILECRWTPGSDAEGRAFPYVNFERRLVDYGEGFGNKRRALVPINDELLADLQAARRTASTGFVVEYRGRPVESIKNAFAAACDRAGLKNVTPHILRHTGATWLVEDNVPFGEIAKMMGDTVEMVERVYGHHSPTYLIRAANALQLENRAGRRPSV